jgi:ABC-2 type transport system permease protein
MNLHGVKAIYRFEMARTLRTLWQSIVSPVISTSLYFVVFGSAIGGPSARWTAWPTAPSSCRG